MVGTAAFCSEVNAYPAITVMERRVSNQENKITRVFARPKIDRKALGRLAHELTKPKLTTSSDVREIDKIAADGAPWILENFDALALVRRLESRFPTIEEAGCKVGIGAATGADRAFIGDFEELDVEPSRKIPLVMTKDIIKGQVRWRGKGVINPFGDDGGLVRLENYPKLKCYLEEHSKQLAKRYIATKAPQNWYCGGGGKIGEN